MSVVIENASIWNRSWKWIKTKTHVVLVRTAKTHQNENEDRNIAGACVCSMRIGFNLRHNVQFYRFRTFECEQSTTHQNGRVDANRSTRFRWQRRSVDRALDWQNNDSASTITLYWTFPCSRCTTTKWKFLLSRFTKNLNKRKRTNERILLEFNSRKIRQHLTNWTRWNRREEVWSSANSLFV